MNIDSVFDKYREAIHRLNERRQHWRKTSKEIVKQTFSKIKENYDEKTLFGLYVEEHEFLHNMSSVQFSLGQIPNGLSKKIDEKDVLGVLHGPSIMFGQGNDGRIYISIHLFADELPGENWKKPSHILLAITEPENINEEFVYKAVEKALLFALKKSHLCDKGDIFIDDDKDENHQKVYLANILWAINQIPEIKNLLSKFGLEPITEGSEFFDIVLKVFLINKEKPIEIKRFIIGSQGFILMEDKSVIFYHHIFKLEFSRFLSSSLNQ